MVTAVAADIAGSTIRAMATLAGTARNKQNIFSLQRLIRSFRLQNLLQLDRRLRHAG